jgi:beta-lactam-binding protein with PASTA domain
MKTRSAVLVLAAVIALVVSGCTVKGCGSTAVPDVKGKTALQAEEALVAAGFKTGKIVHDAAAQGALGAVIAQDPVAGAGSSAGAVVNLTVAGPPPVMVPVVTGMVRTAAADALAASGLKAGAVTESTSATMAAGLVISQSPTPALEVPAGSAVDLVVSTGPEKVTPPPVEPPAKVVTSVKVPSLKGLKLATAKSKITALGLKWKHVLGPGDGMLDVGFVYKQSPASGKVVKKGSTVTIYTWVGP